MVGNITLSIEVELAWGRHDVPDADQTILSDRRQAETDTLEKLLSLCDELQIPVSFDVVGHLLEESCSGAHDGPQAEGWFAADPGTDVEVDPLFYAPDLVKMIREAETDHEICTHSYSHVLADRANKDVMDWEVQTVDDLWRRHSLPSPVSYVAPRHESPPYEVLRNNGIDVVRVPIDDIDLTGGPIRSYIQRHRNLIPDMPPSERHGVVETYSTPFPSLSSGALQNGQRPPPKSLQLLPVSVRQRLHLNWLIKQTQAIVERNGYLHLWTHLFNIANEEQIKPVFQYLRHLAKLRDDSKVNVKRMRDLSRVVVGDNE